MLDVEKQYTSCDSYHMSHMIDEVEKQYTSYDSYDT